MIRLAWLCTDPGIRYGGTKGACAHVELLASATAAEGARILLIVSGMEPGAPAPPPGVEVEVLPGPGRGASVAERLAAEPARSQWLAGRLIDFGAQALYERFALYTAIGVRAAAACRIPYFVELNAPLLQEAATYRTLEKPETAAHLERVVLSQANRVLSVTRPLAEHARRCGARRVAVVPNAADPARFTPTNRSGAARAVFMGTLRPWHGISSLASAWRLLGSAAPSLLVVGDGPGREQLEAVGAEVTGSVPRSAVASFLTSADIGLVPYPADGPRYFSPLKLFEYLAAGLAVVAADLPGVVDVVGDDVVMLVPAGDPGALAAAVALLTDDPALRHDLGARARSWVERHHTWNHRARHILELVRESLTTAAVVPADRTAPNRRPTTCR